jgi:hypothetical protein
VFGFHSALEVALIETCGQDTVRTISEEFKRDPPLLSNILISRLFLGVEGTKEQLKKLLVERYLLSLVEKNEDIVSVYSAQVVESSLACI